MRELQPDPMLSKPAGNPALIRPCTTQASDAKPSLLVPSPLTCYGVDFFRECEPRRIPIGLLQYTASQGSIGISAQPCLACRCSSRRAPPFDHAKTGSRPAMRMAVDGPDALSSGRASRACSAPSSWALV